MSREAKTEDQAEGGARQKDSLPTPTYSFSLNKAIKRGTDASIKNSKKKNL